MQVFPDSYHLNTLHEFLDACAELHPDVHIKNVLGTLIEHLTQYASADESPGIPSDINLFEIFSQHAQQVVGARAEIPTEDVISIQVFYLQSFFKFLNYSFKNLDSTSESGAELLCGPQRFRQHGLLVHFRASKGLKIN